MWTNSFPPEACSEAREWAETQPDLETAWGACPRADWMLWLAARVARTEDERKRVVFATCQCARTALRFLPAGEDRPRIAIETAERWIETAERWTRGEATLAQVRTAAYAVRDAAAYAAAGDAARAKALADMAEIVRANLDCPKL